MNVVRNAEEPGPVLTIFGVNYAPEPAGNAPYTTGLAEYLAGEGWTVKVITGYPHYPAWKRQRAEPRETINGVNVERHRHLVPRTSTAAQRGLFEITWLLSSLPTALRRNDADAVLGLIPNLGGAVLARIAAARNRIPSVLWFQDLMGPGAAQSGISGGDRVAEIVERVETSLAKGATRIMVAAEGFRPHFESIGIPPSRITRARNWNRLPPVSLDRDATRDAFAIDREAVVALHSGNMGMKQGLEVVVGAAEHAPEILWVLQGHGNVRPELESQVEERGLSNVRFLPSLSGQELANLLASADVLLVTQRSSVSDMSLPSKLASYSTAGVPIVASVHANSETALEVADDRIGRLVHPGDPLALARAVEAVAAGETAVETESAPERADQPSRYDAQASLQAIERTLKKVIDGRFETIGGSQTPFDLSKPILVLAPHLMLPARNGADILVEQSARHLSAYAPEVLVLGAEADIRYVAGERVDVRVTDRHMRSRRSAALRTIGSRSHYYREKFLTPGYRAAVADALAAGDYGGIVCSYLTTVEAVAGSPLPVAAWTHNDEFRWFTDLRTTARDPVRRLTAESSLAYLGEHAARLASAARLAHVSPEDRDGFVGAIGAHTNRVIPIGADVDVPVAPPVPANTQVPTLLFVGSLSVGMNADALHHFETALAPRIRAAVPGLRVVVCGSAPSPSVRKACSRNGWDLVPDASSEELDALYDGATFAILPFAYATGSKLKLLGALAHGVPVLATYAVTADPSMFDGLSVRSDDPDEWVAAITAVTATGISEGRRSDLRRIAEESSWEGSVRQLAQYLAAEHAEENLGDASRATDSLLRVH